MVLGRLYGGGALIVGTRRGRPGRVGALRCDPEAVGPNGVAFLHAVSRWQLGVTETDRDPLSPWFGEPLSYEVDGARARRAGAAPLARDTLPRQPAARPVALRRQHVVGFGVERRSTTRSTPWR